MKKSKVQKKAISILLTVVMISSLVAVFAMPAAAMAPPPKPHTFWGTVYIDGVIAPDGTVVSARDVYDVVLVSTIVSQGHGDYSLDVREPDHATRGDPLHLWVGEISTGEIYTFTPSGVTRLDLSVVMPPDIIEPTVVITIDDPINIANVGAVAVTITSDEAGTYAFTIADAAYPIPVTVTGYGTIAAGETITHTLNLTALADGPITADATVEDAAGNVGTAPRATATKNTVEPVVTITIADPIHPGNVAAVVITIHSDEAGTYNFTIDDVDVPATAPITGTGAIAAGQTITHTLNLAALVDGLITADATVEDTAGNVGTAPQATATKNMVAPTVTITIADPINIANVGVVAVTITSDEDGTYTITIDDAIDPVPTTPAITRTGTITAGVPITHTLDLATLADGIINADATVVDAVTHTGTAPRATATKNVVAPVVVITSTAPDPTDVSPIPMKAAFSEAVIGFTADNITLTNAVLVADTFVTADNITWIFLVTPVADGLVTVDIPAGVATDAATNPNIAAPQFRITFTAMVTFDLHLRAGWNMISLPVDPIVTCPRELLPAARAIWFWNAEEKRYDEPTELVAGKGYWVLVFEDVIQTIKGTPVEAYTVAGDAGWHMIGSLWVDGEVDVIRGIVFADLYTWDPVAKAFISTRILEPGRGYWLLALEPFEVRVVPVPPGGP